MRPDMFEVIIERPRRGGHGVIPTHYRITDEGEHIPKYESMKSRYYGGGSLKELNENLKPLYRFLDKQVGRPWNDVWSELCEHLDDSSSVKKHVKDHASEHVNMKVCMINGKPHVYAPRTEHKRIETLDAKGHKNYYYESIGGFTHKNGWVELGDRRTYFYNKEIYVDPDTGILSSYRVKKLNRIKYGQKPPRDYPFYKTVNGNEYRYLDGIWYFIEFKTIKYKELENARIWKDGKYYPNPDAKWVEKTRTIELKQQLGKKDKRRLLQWIATGVWGPPQKKVKRKIFRKV